MAHIPSDKDIESLHEDSREAELNMRDAQEKEGKDFLNYGQGVLPSEVWENLPGKKEQDDGRPE